MPRRSKGRPPRAPEAEEDALLRRLAVDPGIFGGRPIIRGHRLTAEAVLAMLAQGATTEELLEAYPFLEPDDIRACLAFARRMVAHESIEPLEVRERP